MKYKRILAALTAFSLLLCGCQGIDTYDAEYNTNENAPNPAAGSIVPVGEDGLTTIAKREVIPLPEGVDFLYKITPMGDGFTCFAAGNYEGDYSQTHIFHYNVDFTEYTETVLVALAPYEGYYSQGGLVAFGEDAYYTLSVMENHSNMEPYQDGDEDYDFNRYYESWESDYYLCTYTADGTLAGKVQITGLEEYKDDQGYDRFSDLYCDGENTYLFLQTGCVLRIHADGTLEEITPALEDVLNPWIASTILYDRDGKPILSTYQTGTFSYDYSTDVYTLAEFDVKTGKTGEPFYSFETMSALNQTNICSGGLGDYRMFVTEKEELSAGAFTDRLYGIKDDGTKEVVIDWDASDMEGMSVTPLADGTFIGDWSQDENMYHITRKAASEMKEKQTIRIGVLGQNYYIKDFVREYNRSHDDYNLYIVTYSSTDGSNFSSLEKNDSALDNLKLAVVSGDAPDLVVMQGSNYPSASHGSVDFHDTFLWLGSRGVFCDLNELMENDPEVNRDTLVPNVLTAMQHPNGSLYSLTRGFFVWSIAVKSKFVDKENWTMDDMIALYEDADDMKYYWSTKQDTLSLLLTGTDFTDELNGTCNFDSPEFIKMLEFCNRYPMESTCPEKDYNDPDQMAKLNQWYYNSYNRYREDTDYLYYALFGAFTDGFAASNYAYTKAELGGSFTLAGYPSNNGKGGRIVADGEIAILSTCSDKAAAWEVVKEYMHDTTWQTEYNGYSIFNGEFEEQLDKEMYIMNFGERSDAEYFDNQGTHVYPLTQEERDGLETYIRKCDTYMMLDAKVEAIIYEEAGMYFSGDRSAEDTAKMIQSRAELYLSEQS